MDRTKGITALLDSLHFFGLFGVTEPPPPAAPPSPAPPIPATRFERRYQKSFLSLKLGLAVWSSAWFLGRPPSERFQRLDIIHVSNDQLLN